MTEVKANGTIPAPIDEVWALVGDFEGIDKWLGPLASSTLAEGATGREVGDERTVVILGGPTMTERQEARSDAEYTYTYSLPDDSPLPITSYRSTIALSADGDRTTMEWGCTFEASSGTVEEIEAMVQGIYEAGIEGVRLRFEV